MRVARLIERLPPASGGKEVHGAELTRALGELGVEQHVFCRVGDQLAGDIGQSVVRPGLARRAHTLLTWCAAAARAIEGAHAGDPFDLIHAHGDFLEATAAAVAARRLSIPAVLTVHGGLSDVPWHDELRLLSYSAMEQVIAVSQSIAERIRMIGISSDVHVAPSGVRAEFLSTPRRAPERPLVVTVGRLAPVKGLETLLEAHDLLADEDVSWLVVARGDGRYAERMRAEIERRPRMACVEEPDPKRLAHRLAAATAFVLPSVELDGQHEGAPTALLEAGALGLPVIATRTGGVAQLLGNGGGGILVEPGDAARLAAAIGHLVADPAVAAEHGERVRAAVKPRPWPTVAAETLGLYEGAITRSGRRSALLAVPWFDIGGAEKFVLSVARGLRARGLRTAIAAVPGRLLSELDEDIEHVPLRHGTSAASAIHNTLALAGAATRLRPLAVNSHHVPTGVLARAATTLARMRTRHVLTLHTTEEARMAPVAGAVGSLLFSRVLCVGQSVADEFSRWAIPGRRDRFAVVRFRLAPSAPVEKPGKLVGCVARLVGRKGHPVLIEAWSQVMQDPRATGWQLELWGEGPDRELLEQLSLGVPGIRLLGAVERAADEVGRFDILVLPSLREGLPIALLEAMAADCAVVASDLPGCREVIADGAGVLVPAGDATALAQALLELIADPAKRQQLARQGRRAEQLFSREQMVDAYYRAICGHA